MKEKGIHREAISFIVVIFLVLLLLLWNTAGAIEASPRSAAEIHRAEPSGGNDADASKIMSLLESRGMEKKVLDKVADKMSDMPGRELHLMSSLCDRISENSDTPAADLAYSLLTALIVLS